MNKGPLGGVRITEFTAAWAGPYATELLALLGAEVIKIESRKRLDHSRKLSFTAGAVFTGPDESWVFECLNLNKRSVTLNVSNTKAVEIAKRLVTGSDVVVENMRPGVMERLGLGYECLRACNPGIIYLSSSACGQSGPESRYTGYASTFAAAGGCCELTGYEDWPPSNFLGDIDLRSATTAACAILAALIYRYASGEGQYIDLASKETIAAMIGEVLLDYSLNGRVQRRQGNHDVSMAPHNFYRCRGEDRWISIAIATDDEWRSLCEVMGKPELAEDAKFANGRRKEAQEELDGIIEDWTVKYDSYALTEMLQKAGVAAAPCLSGEDVFRDLHVREREIYQVVEHPVIGKDWIVSPPWRLSETPAAITRHAPLLGEHNEMYLHELLGISQEELEVMAEEGVIY